MTTSESLVVVLDAVPAASCDACPHPRQEHDPLGVRYCAATTASALPRGCICR